MFVCLFAVFIIFQELKKRKYLCPTDYDENYYNWDCLPGRKPPSNGAYWYTACGVPLPNRAEYIAIISIICVLGATVYGNLHFRSSGDAVFKTRNSSDLSNVTHKQKIKEQ